MPTSACRNWLLGPTNGRRMFDARDKLHKGIWKIKCEQFWGGGHNDYRWLYLMFVAYLLPSRLKQQKHGLLVFSEFVFVLVVKLVAVVLTYLMCIPL